MIKKKTSKMKISKPKASKPRVSKAKKEKPKKDQLPARITNDTVAEHREKVLADGRKHKYPLQYTRNKLIRNTIIISVSGLILLVVGVWAQLYIVRDTSDIAYRITRAIPLPIAAIDGKNVRYSDYLLYHRSTVAVQNARGGGEAEDKASFQRQEALNRAIEKAYVEKIAAERGIYVGEDQVNAAIENAREASGLSESAYESTVSDLNWSMDDMRTAFRATLLKQAVSFSVDEKASKLSQDVNERIRAEAEKDLKDIAGKFNEQEVRVEYVDSVTVSKNNADGGLTEAAKKLKPGDISAATKTLRGDGYYFIQLRDENDQSLRYSYIKVPLMSFQEDIVQLLNGDEVKKYVNVE